MDRPPKLRKAFQEMLDALKAHSTALGRFKHSPLGKIQKLVAAA